MKKINKNWLIFFGVQLTILLVGTLVDLNLSHAVYRENSSFGFILELFGELPLTILATTAALYKGISYFNEKKVSAIVHFVVAGLFSLMSAFQIPHYLNITSLTLSIIVFVIMLTTLTFVAMKFPKNDKRFIKYASLIIFVAFMDILVINVIKQFWGRERYRHMVANNNYDGFSAWFIPQGMAAGEEFKSFPSGHSANASIIMLLALFPFKDKSLNGKVFIGVAFYTTLVQLSRIMQGAHFLSDVTMGVLIGLIIILVGVKIFKINQIE